MNELEFLIKRNILAFFALGSLAATICFAAMYMHRIRAKVKYTYSRAQLSNSIAGIYFSTFVCSILSIAFCSHVTMSQDYNFLTVAVTLFFALGTIIFTVTQKKKVFVTDGCSFLGAMSLIVSSVGLIMASIGLICELTRYAY